MTHYIIIEDDQGEMVDRIDVCSDACHRDWCRDNDQPYEGWHGCNETELTDWCASCKVVLPGSEDACECQQYNVSVNRFPSEHGDKCEHGNWIQLPD